MDNAEEWYFDQMRLRANNRAEEADNQKAAKASSIRRSIARRGLLQEDMAARSELVAFFELALTWGVTARHPEVGHAVFASGDTIDFVPGFDSSIKIAPREGMQLHANSADKTDCTAESERSHPGEISQQQRGHAKSKRSSAGLQVIEAADRLIVRRDGKSTRLTPDESKIVRYCQDRYTTDSVTDFSFAEIIQDAELFSLKSTKPSQIFRTDRRRLKKGALEVFPIFFTPISEETAMYQYHPYR